jgi:uncharacterized membrane protein
MVQFLQFLLFIGVKLALLVLIPMKLYFGTVYQYHPSATQTKRKLQQLALIRLTESFINQVIKRMTRNPYVRTSGCQC